MTYPFRPYHGPGVDSAPSETEYQEHFPVVKAVREADNLTTFMCRNVMDIWERNLGLLRDSFTFNFTCNLFQILCQDGLMMVC